MIAERGEPPEMAPKYRIIISTVLAAVLTVSLLSGRTSALEYTGTGSYLSGKYYRRLSQVNLTGDPQTDIVAVARSQVGYQEGGSVNQLSGEVYGGVNHTEYGAWYGLQDMWCAMFVSWCANLAGISQDTVPSHCYTPDGLEWFISRGLAYSRADVQSGMYTPKPGDLIYFKSSRNAKPTNHVGIVTGYANGRVYTVEGNIGAVGKTTSGGMVAELSYPISNTYIAFICAPAYESGSTNVPSRIDAAAVRRESLRNALFSLESGESLRYDAVYGAGAAGVTVGCGQWYGSQAEELLRTIRQEDPAAYRELDPDGLLQEGMKLPLREDRLRILRAVLASEAGVRVQNSWMDRCLENWMSRAEALGVTDPEGRLLCAALYQLRGNGCAEGIIAAAGPAPTKEMLLTTIQAREPGLYRTCCLLVE